MASESTTFRTEDGIVLEGRLGAPDDRAPHGGVVLCHPHPQYGGSMSSKIIPALQRAFVTAGWAALRFNFRGVGRSEGSFGGGVAEVADVAAALERLRVATDGGSAAVVGWSFGALVALNAVAQDRQVVGFVAIAPPARAAFHGTFELPPVADLDGWNARALFVCGSEDPFCRPADLKELASLVPGAEVRIMEDADHFFANQMDELCNIVVDFVTGS